MQPARLRPAAHLIAQEPAGQRDQSRLLVVRRAEASLAHRTFRRPARAAAPRRPARPQRHAGAARAGCSAGATRTGGKWEGLFLRAARRHLGDAVPDPRPARAPARHRRRAGAAAAALVGRTGRTGHWLVRPEARRRTPVELLARHGQVPLPPYIRKGRRAPGDRERYQTVYARRAGAVAAPTAGLHFTPELFDRLDARGIGTAFVTCTSGPARSSRSRSRT